MAKVQTVEVADELKNLQRSALEQSDRFVNSVIQGHKSLPSDARKKKIKAQSLFGFLSPLWRSLTPAQKAVWATAGVHSSLTNWQLFISDNAARLRSDLTLEIPPSELWQVRAGRFLIESPASELILKQEHPLSYWVAKKIVGASWKSELVEITETFSLPLDLEIRYKSNLVPVGGVEPYTPPAGNLVNFELSEYTSTTNPDFSFSSASTGVARFYAQVWTSYQGEDIYTDFEIPLDSVSDWSLETLEITGLRGIIVGYTLFLEIKGYRGELLFDNIRAVHGGTNWARDPRCDDISKTFTKGFAIVPPFWVPVSLPIGSSFLSSYPPSL